MHTRHEQRYQALADSIKSQHAQADAHLHADAEVAAQVHKVIALQQLVRELGEADALL